MTWRRVASSLTSRLDEHTDLQRGVERLHMLRKHLGQESDIDVWLEPIVFHLAVDQLKSGNGSPQVRHALRQCLRISPGRSRLRHATAAHLRAIGRRRVG
ncbi:MAG: hypothetical protein JWN97_2890 [Nocardioides sp.]|nr:hypothetical protein [Nocardioides sp.]